jgi:hypothetical protein
MSKNGTAMLCSAIRHVYRRFGGTSVNVDRNAQRPIPEEVLLHIQLSNNLVFITVLTNPLLLSNFQPSEGPRLGSQICSRVCCALDLAGFAEFHDLPQ